MAKVTFKKGEKLVRIERRIDKPETVLKQIGALMVAESQAAFKAQAFGKDKWRARSDVNVFGIIHDFSMGRTSPPKRRFDRRPALRDTGRLASSIAFRVSTDFVEVGTNLPYAAVHQRGGETTSEPISEKVQKALAKWLRRQGKDMKRRLGWLLNKKFRGQRLAGKVPARPFIGVTQKTKKDVKRLLQIEIMEAK